MLYIHFLFHIIQDERLIQLVAVRRCFLLNVATDGRPCWSGRCSDEVPSITTLVHKIILFINKSPLNWGLMCDCTGDNTHTDALTVPALSNAGTMSAVFTLTAAALDSLAAAAAA